MTCSFTSRDIVGRQPMFAEHMSSFYKGETQVQPAMDPAEGTQLSNHGAGCNPSLQMSAAHLQALNMLEWHQHRLLGIHAAHAPSYLGWEQREWRYVTWHCLMGDINL